MLGLVLAGALALSPASPGGHPAGHRVHHRVHHGVHHRADQRAGRWASPSWTVRIPAIRVDAQIVPTGINRDGTVAVPSLTDVSDVGWYRYGAVPGAIGSAVLLGHVDTYSGPAVFYRLYLLRRGDTVYVRTGRRTAAFTVTSLRQVSKRDFPEGVYAPGGPPVLYLITCAGAFDYATRHYEDNIIVTARPREQHDRVTCCSSRDSSRRSSCPCPRRCPPARVRPARSRHRYRRRVRPA
jgi:LPXTG-site transpeptidase (sortase) family protein